MSPIVSIHPRSLSTCYERIEYWRSTTPEKFNCLSLDHSRLRRLDCASKIASFAV
jgi:hypothetical protein